MRASAESERCEARAESRKLRAESRSVSTQRRHRINPRRAARGHERREDGDDAQQRNDECDRDRVARRNRAQVALNEPSHRERTGEAKGQARRQLQHRAPHEQQTG
jgi:hypothetical protein